MRYILHVTCLGLICLLVLVCSCKKSTTDFNLSTPGLTATLNGQSAQYLVPAGLVNYTTLSGYEKTTTSNTIILTIDTSVSGIDTFGHGANSLVIVNNGTLFSSAYNRDAFTGVANVTISGNKVTGTFSGILYTNPGAVPPVTKDSLIVTNGTISSTY